MVTVGYVCTVIVGYVCTVMGVQCGYGGAVGYSNGFGGPLGESGHRVWECIIEVFTSYRSVLRLKLAFLDFDESERTKRIGQIYT